MVIHAKDLNRFMRNAVKRIATLEAQLAAAEREIKLRKLIGQRLLASEAAREKAEAERDSALDISKAFEAQVETLLGAWEAARKSFPPDRDLNQPWSQAIAIMADVVIWLPDRARQVQAVVEAAIEETKAERKLDWAGSIENQGSSGSVRAQQIANAKQQIKQAEYKRRAAVSALTKDTTDDG